MKTVKSSPLLDIFSRKKPGMRKEAPKETIIIDYREKNSLVASHLLKLGFEVEFKELKIGDYIVKNVIIERKTVSDFISSMINHRLLNQIEELKHEPHLFAPENCQLGLAHFIQPVFAHLHPTAAWLIETTYHMKQSRFSAARLTHDSHKITARDFQ